MVGNKGDLQDATPVHTEAFEMAEQLNCNFLGVISAHDLDQVNHVFEKVLKKICRRRGELPLHYRGRRAQKPYCTPV